MRDDLAIEALARIERSRTARIRRAPGWRQSAFPEYAEDLECQTAFCFAGHVVAAAGHIRWQGQDQALEVLELEEDTTNACGHVLFSPDNSLNRLYKLVAREAGLDESVVRDKVKDLL